MCDRSMPYREMQVTMSCSDSPSYIRVLWLAWQVPGYQLVYIMEWRGQKELLTQLYCHKRPWEGQSGREREGVEGI